MLTALLVIGILVLLIVGHELGHFLAAKFFKVRVEEFGIGYPPRAFLLGSRNGTDYTLNWLPLGGFVRLFGDEGNMGHGPRSFVDAKRYVQAIILVAGVAANIVLAWFLFSGALMLGIPRVVEVPGPHEPVQLFVAGVIAGSPAAVAGLTTGDEILNVHDSRGAIPASLTPEKILEFTRARGGQPISFSYERGGKMTTVSVRPAQTVIADQVDRPAVGVALVLVSSAPFPLSEVPKEAFSRTWDAFTAVGSGLFQIVGGLLHGRPSLSGVVGPVGLVSVISDAAVHGMGSVLALAAFISVNLAVVNLIPIPALDGGRLLLLGIEAVQRKKAPLFVVRLLNMLGVVLIGLLMITVTYHDIARLF